MIEKKKVESLEAAAAKHEKEQNERQEMVRSMPHSVL